MAREHETYRLHLEFANGVFPGVDNLKVSQVAQLEGKDPRTVRDMFRFYSGQISTVAWALSKAKKDAGVEPVYLRSNNRRKNKQGRQAI